MTPEAVKLRGGGIVVIEKVKVSITEKGNLAFEMPENMGGAQFTEWLKKNAAAIGYVPVGSAFAEDAVPSKKAVGVREIAFEPLKPHTEN